MCRAARLSFTWVALSPLRGDTMLRIVENGLHHRHSLRSPHQCAHWLAMTVVFDTFRSKMRANSNEKYVIAKPEGLWQSASPCIRRMLGDHRSPHSHSPPNNHFPRQIANRPGCLQNCK